ncbi:beta-xylosidase [Lentzea guizhouensis]|uniref:Beta-xylosidase n=1 Tax=Lentzea guizhouensis TaxID=1586287 RepID=A0A1B2HDQ0_9PSEU|nr:beta-xylosidase [Lentzea guizhouensis]ANZ35833.1 beta-xylosidase [Lentzea guizhouensis]
MSLSRRPLPLLAALALVGAVTACTNAAVGDPVAAPSEQKPTSTGSTRKAPAPRNQIALKTELGRQSPGVVVAGAGDAPYNYAPAVMFDGGKVRTWWCSQLSAAPPGGDDVLYSEGPGLDGPMSTAVPVFSGSGTSFDAMHTCDPSLIKIGGTYYMYYTGASRDNHANGSSVGVATSPDGIGWTRANNGQSIVVPSGDVIRENTYGAGQQSAVYLDGWVYLMFTDTTGLASHQNGAGQYVLRSKDPTFTSGVEALSASGFQPVSATNKPRTRSVVEAFSADWMWIDAASTWAIAHSTDHGTTVTFWNKDFTRHPFSPVLIPGIWREGPGLARTPLGHAPVNAVDPCGRVALDVFRSTVDGAANAPTNITRFGLDVLGLRGCETSDEASALNGFAMPSPERTVDVVVGGKVVRFERRSVAEKFARTVLNDRPPGVDHLKVAARVPAGVPAVANPQGVVGLLLEDKLWVIGSAEAANLNSSDIRQVSAEQWERYERHQDLAAR